MEEDLDAAAAFAVDAVHEGNHAPGPGNTSKFQESWAFAWYDPHRQIGGWHHLGMQRVLGIADIWSWIIDGDRPIHRFQTLDMELPAGEFAALQAGPFKLTTLEPLKHHRIELDDGNTQAQFECQAFIGPMWFSRNKARPDSHYESFNHMQGSIRRGAETIEVSGFAFLNRSWGDRDWSTLLAMRIVWACFGDDLVFRLFHFTTPTGANQHGFVFDRGVLHRVVKVDFQVTMNNEGAEPSGVIATAWTNRGRAYRLSGQCRHSNLNTQVDGYMYGHGSTVFEHAGRLGTGFLQVTELKAPTPQHRAELGLRA